MLRSTIAKRCRTLPPVARNLLFFGGDEVSVGTLRAIHQRGGGRLEVVHPPPCRFAAGDKKKKTPSEVMSPVECYCLQHNIPHHCVDHPKSIAKSSWAPPWGNPKADFDATVVSSCRYFLPGPLLDALPPAINMHPSLLPLYRGASPIYETLRRGESEGGISVIKLESRFLMDCGDVLLQRRLPIEATDDLRTYFPRVVQEGGAAVVEVLDDFAARWEQARPQANNTLHFKNDPHHARLLDKTPGRLVWGSITGEEARNTWRAFVSYAPVGSCFARASTPAGAKIKNPLKISPLSATFNEIFHPGQVSDAVLKELDIVDAQAQPGAAYFPYTRNSDGAVVGAVKCRSGWFLYRSMTLRNGGPQSPAVVAATAECRLGFVYNGVFVADAAKDPKCAEAFLAPPCAT